MPHVEMTITEMLNDPLIRQLLHADGLSVKEFEALLLKAARSLSMSRRADDRQQEGASVSPVRR